MNDLGHIPAEVVRKIENRVLAFHYHTLANLTERDDIAQKELYAVIRSSAARYKKIDEAG